MIAQNKAMTWIGWIIAVLIGLLMSMGVVMIFVAPEKIQEGMSKYGYPKEAATSIIIAEAVCLVLYLIPRTAVLEAVLLTGYLGGAVATHVRAQENFAMAAVVGVFVWLGLYLRDSRIRALLPLRS